MKKVYQVTAAENVYVVIARNKRKARKEVSQVLTGISSIADVEVKRPKVKVERLRAKKTTIVCMGARGTVFPMIAIPESPAVMGRVEENQP